MRLLAVAVALAGFGLASACTITHKTDGKPVERKDAGDGDGDGDGGGMDASRDSGELDAAPDADDATEEDPPDAAPDVDMGGDDDAGEEPVIEISCEEQVEESLDGLPNDVDCIGLYSDVATKTIAPGVQRYVPGLILWSDGAGKQRWVSFPEGEKIDATDPNSWVFPVGTKFYKEFRVDGRRVETRTFQKVNSARWIRGTYRWNEDETRAVRSFGEDLGDTQIAGKDYHIPSGTECEQCHGGRKDRVLGFEAVALGLPTAEGITLSDLVAQDLIAPVPARTEIVIGDDGTGLGADVVGYLHMNCGVCCHNDNRNAEAYPSRLFMKLDANELDGRPINNIETLQLLINQDAKTLRWGDKKRIIPGDPQDSLLYQLITSRAGPKEQMPPIATKVVDSKHTEVIRQWIEALAPEEEEE